MVIMTTVSFYLITAYTPTFGKERAEAVVDRQPDRDVLRRPVELHLAAGRWARCPTGSAAGRCCWSFTMLTHPHRLSGAGVAGGRRRRFARLLVVELWLSFLYGSYNGAMVVALTEIMPVEVRTAGFSLAYSLATALFGGFTPAISTWLIRVTGNKAAPGSVPGCGGDLRADRDAGAVSPPESRSQYRTA